MGITRAQRSLTISYCDGRKSAESVMKEDAKARSANLKAMLGSAL